MFISKDGNCVVGSPFYMQEPIERQTFKEEGASDDENLNAKWADMPEPVDAASSESTSRLPTSRPLGQGWQYPRPWSVGPFRASVPIAGPISRAMVDSASPGAPNSPVADEQAIYGPNLAGVA